MQAFGGFGPRALDFFRALGFHQDKAWFEENRALYEEEVKAPLVALVAAVTAELAEGGPPLRGDARALFRLHRDTRFAKDKRPYKTNGGAVLTRDGQKWTPGLLYIHVDPEGCFTASGFYRPEPEALLSMRRRIATHPGLFRDMVAALAGAGLALGDGDPMTRNPKGFEAVQEPDLAAAIRMRNLVVRRPLAPEALRDPALPGRIAAFARDAEPLLRFGWDALGQRVP